MLFRAALLLASASFLMGADPQLLGLIPPQARIVAGVNIAQARATPFGQFVLSRMETESEGLNKFVAITGFDPRRDLREAVFASAGEGSDSKHGVAILRGSFDTARILAAARADGQNVETYQGVEIASGKGGKNQAGVAFLDSTLAIAGDVTEVRSAIGRRGSPTALVASIGARIAQLGATQDAWVVSLGPVAGFNPGVRDRALNGVFQGDVARSIEQASAGVKFGSNVQLTLEATARTDKDATAVADVARFLVGMAQLNIPEGEAARLAPFFNSLDIRTQANTVKLTAAVPEMEFENLLGQRPKKAARK